MKNNLKILALASLATLGSLNAKDMQVIVENKTGEEIKHLKVVFRFLGQNDINDVNYAYGKVILENIQPDTKAIAKASEAKARGVAGKVAEHFTNIDDIYLSKFDGKMITHEMYDRENKRGTKETDFVITNPEGRASMAYTIETKQEYNERIKSGKKAGKKDIKSTKTTKKMKKETTKEMSK